MCTVRVDDGECPRGAPSLGAPADVRVPVVRGLAGCGAAAGPGPAGCSGLAGGAAMTVNSGAEDLPVRVVSMFGAQTREPLVTLVIGDQMHTWRSEEARRIGLMLVEVSMASDADAFIFTWVKDAVKADDAAAVATLRDFREWRQARGGGDGG